MELGVVDLRWPVEEQAAAMAGACRDLGFFRLPLDVVDRRVADEAWDAATRFFDLDEAAKREVEFPEPGYPYGFSAFRAETLARSVGTGEAAADLKESLSVGPDCGPERVSSPGEAWIRSPSLWPRHVPDLRSSWTAYYRALSEVAARLMRVMATALELPADHFDRLIDRPITSMRAIRYPAGHAEPGPALRAGAHSDYGTFTILRTDRVPGLEIERSDGTWVAVEPDPDHFVVNLGDTIAQWTNDRWRSTMHRVVPGVAQRQSFAFFHMANWDAVIECLPTCLEPGETSRHEPVQAGPWLMGKFQSTVS